MGCTSQGRRQNVLIEEVVVVHGQSRAQGWPLFEWESGLIFQYSECTSGHIYVNFTHYMSHDSRPVERGEGGGSGEKI